MDRGKLERATRLAAEDGLLPGITEVVRAALHQPGPYTAEEKQNFRDALTLLDGYSR